MNTTALAIIQPNELETIQRTGRMLAASGYFDAKGESAQSIAMMATKILAGREIGIGPFAAVNGIHIIKGKPSIGANLLAASVKGSGRYDYRVRELTDKVCKIEFFQRSGDKLESLGISEFTAEDARKAQTQNMDKYPKNMLFARAMSNGVRFYVPDVFNGNAVYVPEELGAEVDGDGNVIDVTPRRVDTTTGEIVADVEFMGSAQNGATSPQQAQEATEDKLVTLRRERLNIEMSDLEHNHEKRELARIDAEIAKLEQRSSYAALIDKLSGDCLERANRARNFHANGKGPSTPEQYRYLSGVIDDLVGVQKAHNAILEVFVGRAVNGENPPSILLASKLLDALVKEKAEEVDGKKVMVPNPSYSVAAVNCVHTVWRLVREADGQASLFEQVAA